MAETIFFITLIVLWALFEHVYPNIIRYKVLNKKKFLENFHFGALSKKIDIFFRKLQTAFICRQNRLISCSVLKATSRIKKFNNEKKNVKLPHPLRHSNLADRQFTQSNLMY